LARFAEHRATHYGDLRRGAGGCAPEREKRSGADDTLDTSLLGGIVAASTLLLLNYLIADVSGANRHFRKVIQGQPSLLVHDGKVIESHMAKEHVSMDELQRALREHGISSCHDVALAVLEVDGSISCLKYDEIKPDANTHLVRQRRFLQKHQ
jgi:uncharacterized membrane protein YcaP (DUF421 family)